MNETLVHRGPTAAAVFLDTITARGAAARDHRPRGRRPADRERGRTIHVVQNGEIYNYRELRKELERKGTVHHTPRHRGPCTSTRSAARTLPRRCAGCSRSRSGDGPKRSLARTRPLRDQPLYYRATGEVRSPRAQGLLRQPGVSREIDPDGLEAYLAFSCILAPYRSSARSASFRPATCSSGERTTARPGSSASRSRGRRAPRTSAQRARRSWPRSCASGSSDWSART